MTQAEFEATYHELYSDMVKAAEKMFRDRSVAEDLVQNVFYHVLLRGKCANLDSGRNVRAFLFTRLIWDARKLWASKSWQTSEPLEHADYEDNDDGKDVYQTDEDMRLDVQAALQNLLPCHRRVVEMVAIEGHTFIEVGAQLWPGFHSLARRRNASRFFWEGMFLQLIFCGLKQEI